MASALSVTVWIASSTSVFVTDRMASRSLMSSRPMISALAAYSSRAMCSPPSGRCRAAGGGARSITGIIDQARAGRKAGLRDLGHTRPAGAGSVAGCQRRVQDRLLLLDVDGVRPGGRAARLVAADPSQLVRVAEQVGQAGLDERPGAHVGRLLRDRKSVV